MTGEVWKPIPETEGEYEVSSAGRIRNHKTGVIRKAKVLPNGYARIHYNKQNKRYDRYVHRLVAEVFCNRPEGCNVVNHLDNDKGNNSASNLEWTTQLGNVHHGIKQKRYRLNAKRVIGYKDNQTYEFISINQASIQTGCDHSSISKCCKGKASKTNGYCWKYAEVV